MHLGLEHLDELGLGCALLGAGGGGDVGIALVMARDAIERHGPVDVVATDELAADDIVMPCGLIGAPTVVLERIWNGDEGRVLRDTVETQLNRSVAALMTFEIGGSNGVLAVCWAARLGLPLVDADGMGRALPELQQQTMHLAGIPASPLVLTDGRDNALIIRSADNLWAERLARSGTASLGGACAGALYCMTAAEARRGAIQGSISRALAIGAGMRSRTAERIALITDAMGGRELIDGKLIEIERETSGGFVRGSLTVEGMDRDEGRHLRLEFQNEILIAFEEGVAVASVPDILTVLSRDVGLPIATELFAYGQRVSVIACPSAARWREPDGLALVGPRAFGYELDYAPFDAAPHAH
jgi:uncharacterized protein